MREWMKIIEEAQGLPDTLYHGTSLINLVNIVAHDFVIMHGDDEDTEAFFMSANPATCEIYKTCARNGGEGGIIAFDVPALLEAGYSIMPHYYHGKGEVEYLLTAEHPLASDYELRGILKFVKEIAVHSSVKGMLADHENHLEVQMRDVDWAEDCRKFLAFPRLRWL